MSVFLSYLNCFSTCHSHCLKNNVPSFVIVFCIYEKLVIHFAFLSSVCFLKVSSYCLFGVFCCTKLEILDNNKTVGLGVDVVVDLV